MPFLVRERLFFGNITDAAQALTSPSNSGITHILSLLSSPSISFFSDWKPGLSIPAEGIRKVYAREIDEGGKLALPPETLLYSLERAGVELKLKRMAVPLRDTEDEDLVDYLNVCLDFIDEGRKEGAVLVHCFAGVSRSAAIITAYLMRTEQKSQEDALESLKEVCEFVCPNDGFLEQLKLFEDIGYRVDTSNPLYKRFRLKVLVTQRPAASSTQPRCAVFDASSSIDRPRCLNVLSLMTNPRCVALDEKSSIGRGHSYKQGEKVDSSIFEMDPGQSPESNPSEGNTKSEKPKTVYRCKKCRRVVVTPENIVSHTAGEGESCFGWQKKKSGNAYNRHGEVECNSMFVEPLKWMTNVEEGGLDGKLTCIKCGARLGNFNWAGIQCNCGSWVTPAFQIHKNRVDISTEYNLGL